MQQLRGIRSSPRAMKPNGVRLEVTEQNSEHRLRKLYGTIVIAYVHVCITFRSFVPSYALFTHGKASAHT